MANYNEFMEKLANQVALELHEERARREEQRIDAQVGTLMKFQDRARRLRDDQPYTSGDPDCELWHPEEELGFDQFS